MDELSLFTTHYGRPAAVLLRERISSAKAEDPLGPVTVVVPTNYVAVSARRLLAGGELGPVTSRGEGIAGLTLLTVYRLTELLGAPALAAAGRRPVSTPVVAAAVRGVLSDQPGIFAPVRDHPSTEELLVRAHRELSEVRPDSLDVLAGQSARAADVVRIHRTVRSRLADGWYEEADLMASAREAIRTESPILADLGTVIVYLPQDLAIPSAELLSALAFHAPVEVIAGLTGSEDADADVHRTLDRLGLDAGEVDIAPPTATRVVSVSDPEEEARSAVRAIIAAARDGVALESMAVLYPSPEPYARIVHEQLEAADVPYSGRAVRPLSDRLVGRWLLDLLELPEQGFARPAVMNLLSEAPVRSREGRHVPSGTWERISRDAGVVRGRAEWTDKLERYASEQRARADEEAAGENPREWLVDRRRGNAGRADALRDFVAELFGALADAASRTSWSELAGWCREMTAAYLGPEHRRGSWPEVERDAAERVEAALDRLAGLDEVEPTTDLEVFRRTLGLELDDDLGRVGELGQGVLVGTPTVALGVDLEVVVVLGLAEGVFPTRPREDSLLPDAERAVIGDDLRPRADHVGVEHRHLLAALAASRGTRVMIHPRGDMRRTLQRAPSRWLRDSIEQLEDGSDEAIHALPATAEWLDSIPSFARRVRTAAFPATRQEYGLRALANSRGRLADHPLVDGDRRLRRGVHLLAARRSGRFTRFDGNLSDLRGRLPSPVSRDRPVSATRLEAWLRCPHAYLMRYLLRVEPTESPEELLEISPLEKGSLVHDVLEDWLRARLQEGPPAPTEAWPPQVVEAIRGLAEQACAEAEARGVTGHPLLWRRDRARIIRDLERFVARDDERRRELGATPTRAELAFGLPGSDAQPVTIELGDGRSVLVRGRIDRLDRGQDGTVVVTDYKTGSTYAYRDLSEERPLGDGTKLQLPVYGLAARQAEPDANGVRMEYWFTSAKGEFKQIGYPLTDEVVDRLRQALRVAVVGIEAGLFPHRPPEPGWSLFTECLYCDPDELGTADRYRDWERLRHAPELGDYVALVEPEALADSAGDGADGDETVGDDTGGGAGGEEPA